MHGMRYSQFIAGLVLAKIELDRKTLSEMAIHDPAGFEVVANVVKKALDEQSAKIAEARAAELAKT